MALTLKLAGTQAAQCTPDDAVLRALCAGRFCLGAVGANYAFSPTPPQAGEDGAIDYLVYGDGKPLGRGFVLHVEAATGTLAVVCPLPTTGHDVDDAFALAELLAAYLGLASVQAAEEEQELPLGEALEAFRDVRKLENCLMIKDFADERPGFAVSGVKFPMHMTAAFCEELAALDPQAAEKAFSENLARRQRRDYYYMYPNYYRHTDTGAPLAIYALNDGVDSIIPREPFIPYGGGPYGDTPVESWQVALICGDRHGEVLGTLLYEEFLAALRPGETEDYDDVHLLLHGLPLQRLQEMLQRFGK